LEFLNILFIVAITILFLVIGYFIGQKIGAYRKHKEWEDLLPGYRKEAVEKSRSVLSGMFSEQLAPYLPDFPYSATECKFMGKPVDFLVFKGMDDKKISEVVFVEVKSGKAGLNTQEKNLKDAILNKRVKWEEYRIPEEITKGKEILDS